MRVSIMMTPKNQIMLYLGADKHGYNALAFVEGYLRSCGMEYKNLGVEGADEDMALEELIPRVAKKVLENDGDKGVLICGTGVGVMVGANKIRGIRACLATNLKIARWCVEYDNCNSLCLVGWNAQKKTTQRMLHYWLNAKFDNNEKRTEMLKTFDTWR